MTDYFSDSQKSILTISDSVVSFLSLAGCIWTLHFCIKIRSSSNVSLQIIFAITIADFFYTIGNFLSIIRGSQINTVCYIESAIRELSIRLSLFFSACLAVIIYKSTKVGLEYDPSGAFKKIKVVFFILCAYTASALFFAKDIMVAQDDTNCYLTVSKQDPSKTTTRFMILTIYNGLPMAIFFILIIASYIATFVQIRRLDESVSEGMKVKPYRLFWYPAILLLIFVPRILDTSVKHFNDGKPVFMFKLIHVIGSHCVGLANAFVFGLQMRSYYKRYQEYSDPIRGESFLSESMEEDDIKNYNI